MEDFPSVIGEMDIAMDKVVKHIYASCDPENTNSVPVSLLIEFVKPYMTNNLAELYQLQTQLDPDNTNPSVSSEIFYEVMSKWTSTIKGVNALDNSFDDLNLQDMDYADDHLLSHSTPHSSFQYFQLVRNCPEILNMSNISSYETNDNNNTVGADKTSLEEEIKQLQYQINKKTSELELVKQQLTSAEEQNELLSTDLKKITKLLHSEQQINEQLKKNKVENEDIKEEVQISRKKIEQLEKALITAEKDHQNMSQEMKELESKKLYLENKLEVVQMREHDDKREIDEMKRKIDEKEAEILALTKSTKELRSELVEKNELITFYVNENELAKHKSNTFEKIVKENLTSRTESFLNQIRTERRKSDSGKMFLSQGSLKLENDKNTNDVFNSSKLLKHIANPVHSVLDSSIIRSSKCSKQSVDSDGSPLLKTEAKLLKHVLLKNSSTPRDEIIRNEKCSIISSKLNLNSKQTLLETFNENKSCDLKTDNGIVLFAEKSSEKISATSTESDSSGEDIYLKACVAHSLRSPHKSIQDELSEVFGPYTTRKLNCETTAENEDEESSQDGTDYESLEMLRFSKQGAANEDTQEFKSFTDVSSETSAVSERDVNYLRKQMREQENIKNNLWRDIQHLSSEVKVLKHYRKDYKMLEEICAQKDNIIDELKKKSETTLNKEGNESTNVVETTDCNVKYSDIKMRCVELERALEDKNNTIEVAIELLRSLFCRLEVCFKFSDKLDLSEASFGSDNLCKILNEFHNLLDAVITQIEADQKAIIDVKANFENRVEVDSISSCDSLKSFSDSSVEHKKTNYDKQQLKIERLQEKVNKLKEDVLKERNINTNILTSYQQLSKENERTKEDFQCSQRKVHDLEQLYDDMIAKYSDEMRNKEKEFLEEYENMKKDLEDAQKKINDLENLHDEVIQKYSDEMEINKEKFLEEKQFLNDENEFLNEEIKELKLTYLSSVNEAKEEAKRNINENTDLHKNLQKSMKELQIEKSIVITLQEDNKHLQEKIHYFEMKLQQEELNSISLRKQIVSLLPSNNLEFVELKKALEEKNNEIKDLQEEIRTQDSIFLDYVNTFTTNNCNELERITTAIPLKKVFSNDPDISKVVEEYFDNMNDFEVDLQLPLENKMLILGDQIKFVFSLLKMVISTYYSLLTDHKLLNVDSGSSVFKNLLPPMPPGKPEIKLNLSRENQDRMQISFREDDSFKTCYSDISFHYKFEHEIPDQEVFPHQPDSFLESLELHNDSPRNTLSKKEMEEKFTALALTFTIDFRTTKDRYLKQRKRHTHLLMTFFTHLSSAIHLLKNNTCTEEQTELNSVIIYLEMLESITTDIFRSAERCGILQYEFRSMKCWNLVTNYVAVLRQETKQIEQADELSCKETTKPKQLEYEPVHKSLLYYRHDILQGKRCGFSVLFAFLVIFIVFVVFYTHWGCSQMRKAKVCPLDPLLDLFIQRTDAEFRVF